MQRMMTPELYQEIQSIDDSKITAKVDVIEHIHAIEVRVYQPDVMRLTENERLYLMSYLHEIRKAIEDKGVRCFFRGIVR